MASITDLCILSIIIFGSSARGENDAYSDIDVCVITKSMLDEVQSDLLKKFVSDKYTLSSVDITIYSSSQIESMIEAGSLFLWHVKLEGKILYDSGFFRDIIVKLSKYDKHLSELNYHSELLRDVEMSFEKFQVVNEMDLSQLFTICRNTCMILSHFNNQFAFGRNSAFLAAKQIYPDLPLSQEEYNYLSKWKLRYERGLYDDIKLPRLKKVKDIISLAKKLMYYAIAKVSNV